MTFWLNVFPINALRPITFWYQMLEKNYMTFKLFYITTHMNFLQSSVIVKLFNLQSKPKRFPRCVHAFVLELSDKHQQ